MRPSLLNADFCPQKSDRPLAFKSVPSRSAGLTPRPARILSISGMALTERHRDRIWTNGWILIYGRFHLPRRRDKTTHRYQYPVPRRFRDASPPSIPHDGASRIRHFLQPGLVGARLCQRRRNERHQERTRHLRTGALSALRSLTAEQAQTGLPVLRQFSTSRHTAGSRL